MYEKAVKIKDYKGLTIVRSKNNGYISCKEYSALNVSKIETMERCIDTFIRRCGLPLVPPKKVFTEERQKVVLYYSRWIRKSLEQTWVAIFEGTDTIWKEGTRDYLISKCHTNNFDYRLMTKTKDGILKIAKEVKNDVTR